MLPLERRVLDQNAPREGGRGRGCRREEREPPTRQTVVSELEVVEETFGAAPAGPPPGADPSSGSRRISAKSRTRVFEREVLDLVVKVLCSQSCAAFVEREGWDE